MKKTIYSAILLAALATSCSSDQDTPSASTEDGALRFTSVVNDLTATRAATALQESQIAKDVQVGVFVATTSGDDPEPTDTGDNALLTANGEGGFSSATSVKWPTGATNLAFYAYAPYSSSYTGKLADDKITFSVKTDQSEDADYLASDLLYGAPSTNPIASQPSDANVKLAFTHKLCKVIVELTDNSEDRKLSKPTIGLLNMANTVDLKLTDGTVSTDADTKVGITMGSFATDATTYTAAALVAPQTVKSGVHFIQVKDETGVTYTCSLSADKELVSGNVYKYKVSFDLSGINIIAATTLQAWANADDEGEYLKPVKSVSYGVGDYVLADGSFVAKGSVSSTDNVVGVIFSTTVSAADAAKGYTAYILGFETLEKAAPQGGDNALAFADYEGVTTLKAEAEDLDGLTRTEYIQSLSDYKTKYPLFDLSSLTVSLPAADYSGWFIPSIGQAIQILNNLGGAKLPTDNESYKYYCVMPNFTYTEESITFSGKGYLFAKTPSSTDLVAAFKEATNGQSVLGAQRYATSSIIVHNKANEIAMMDISNNFLGSKVNDVELTTDEKTGVWGISSGGATNQRNRFACIATKKALTF